MDTTQALLDDMRKITMLTGEISSVHQQNLQKWPFVVFDDISGVEIRYDLTKVRAQEVGENLVEFYLGMPKDKAEDIENFERRCSILTDWTRQMFWSEIKVVVYINDIEKYSTKKDDKND